MARVNLRPELAPTAGPGDAARIAQQAVAGGADLILVLGGDGTINEALNGMVNSATALAPLPAGTANVLAIELGLGSRLDRAIARLAECAAKRIAVGRLCGAGSTRHFLLMGGAGLDATIVYNLNPRLKARAGKLAYWAGGFGHIARRVQNFDARIDGKTYRCGFALASRVRNYGGDLEIARGASLLHDDFEVVLFEGSQPLRYLLYMLAAGCRSVQRIRGVHTLHARRVELEGDAHLQVDGEYAGKIPATLEIVPDALTLLMPPSYG